MRPLPESAVRLSLLVAILTVSACHNKLDDRAADSALLIQSTVMPSLARVGPETVNLTLSDPAGKAVTGAIITLEANMSHPGMAPVFSTAKEAASGQYSGVLTLPMAGDWIVSLHMTLTDGSRVERQLEIKGVRAN